MVVWCPSALRVKHKILAINPPHDRRTIINSLFELLLRVALRELPCVLQTNDVRDVANNLRELSVPLCALYHWRMTAQLVGCFVFLLSP